MLKKLPLAALALTFAFAGCRDALIESPKNFLTTDSYYKTPADIEAATFATYQQIGRDDVWRRWLLWDTEMASDMVRVHPDEPNFGTYAPGLLLWTTSDGSMVNPWNGLYTTIYWANLVLEKGPKVTFTDTKYQKQLLAEALFMRAYAYVMLTKAYDGVPLLLTLDDHAKTATKKRAAVEDIHQQMIKDLTAAEADLPDAPTQLGRATKAAAQMLLADLYQWRSSFMKKNEWTQVSTWSKKVVDNPRWGLTDDYLAQYLPTQKGNRESIFMLVSSGVDGRTSTDPNCNWLPRILGFGQNGGCEVVGQPTKWQYESYLCTSPDPLVIDPATKKLADTTKIKSCDYRKQVTYRLSGCSTSAKIGCPVFTWPNLNKFRPSNKGVGGPSDVDFPIYRYAEAMLMYAEAQNELGNPGVAVQYINLLRARARKGNGTTAFTEPHDYGTKGEALGQIAVRDALYQERNWEMAHEGKRWFDQIRRNSIEPGYFISSMNANDPETGLRGDLKEFRMRFPIPQPEMILNPNLVQNTGY